MNWFERYGIVGMFCIVMTALWFFCLFPDSFDLLAQKSNNETLAKYIVGACGLGFLPVGYFIVIFGQILYYNTSLWKKLHCQYWEQLPDKIKKKINDEEEKKGKKALSKDDQKNEAKMEALFSYYDRLHITNVEGNKFSSIFSTKRYDVIAVSRALQITLLISLVIAICLKLVSLKVTLLELFAFLGYTVFSFWFIVAIAIIIWIILHYSSKILEFQVTEISERKFTNILEGIVPK